MTMMMRGFGKSRWPLSRTVWGIFIMAAIVIIVTNSIVPVEYLLRFVQNAGFNKVPVEEDLESEPVVASSPNESNDVSSKAYGAISTAYDLTCKTYDAIDVTRMGIYLDACSVHRLTKLPMGDLSPRAGTPINLSMMTRNSRGSIAECPRTPNLANFPIRTTALVSFPGSGSSLARRLIQQVTGILAGSVYRSHWNDGSSSSNDGNQSQFRYSHDEGAMENVSIIETHVPPFNDGLQEIEYDDGSRVPISYDQLLLLLRNPFDTIGLEYIRNNGSFDGMDYYENLDEDLDENINSTSWAQYFERRTKHWGLFVHSALDTTLPTLVIFYEDLTSCLLPELIKTASFLSSEYLNEFSFCCAWNEYKNAFNTPESYPYTLEEKSTMNRVILETASVVEQSHSEIASRLLQYVSKS